MWGKEGYPLEHQMLDQERETAEETSDGLRRAPQRTSQKQKRPGKKWAMALCVAVAIFGGLCLKVYQLHNRVEWLLENTVAKSTIRDLAYQYGLTTTFLQKLFPQSYVYMGANGITISPLKDDLTQHSYDWSGLSEENGRYQYTAQDGTQALAGVDVSTYNGDIDWAAVKADGISFAMIRLGFRGYGETGNLVLDDKFQQNIQGATQAGLDVGVYFFSQAVTVDEAVEEAEYVLDALEGDSITYPVVFDLEQVAHDEARTDDLSVETATEITQAFCQTIAQAGYQPMIYGNVTWLMDRIDLTQLTEYELWLAQYQSTPTFPYQFTMWQYSHQGSVAGIEGNVDLNLLLSPIS